MTEGSRVGFFDKLRSVFTGIPDIHLTSTERQKAEILGARAAKLGILADRGRLHQLIGKESLGVTVADAIPSPKGRTVSSSFDFERDAAHIIEDGTSLGGKNQKQVLHEWLSRAVNLYIMFNGRNIVTLRVGDAHVPLTDAAIDEAWAEEGFDATVIHNIPNYSGLIPLDITQTQRQNAPRTSVPPMH